MLKSQKIHFFLIIFHNKINRTYQKQCQIPLLKSIENPFLLLPWPFPERASIYHSNREYPMFSVEKS